MLFSSFCFLRRWGKDDPSVLEEGIEAIQQETAGMKDLVEEERNTLDICAIRASILEQYWSRWMRQGYVHRNSARPGVMGLYTQQKKSWF